MADYWNSLVSTAITGTERSAALSNPAGSSAGLAAQVDGSNPERALLARAALEALTRRAGLTPPAAPEYAGGLTPSEPDTNPCCTQKCANLLATILERGDEMCLLEWLGLAASKSWLIPAYQLPRAFDLGTRSEPLRGAIAVQAGHRGRWLASQNHLWRWINAMQRSEPPDLDKAMELWAIGTTEERESLLRSVRRYCPERAPEILQSTWSTDSGEQRTRFIKTLAIGLSIADEPFIESALDDKRKEIRQQACALLAELPESRLCTRMLQRAQELLQLKRAFLRSDIFVVNLPETCDESMLRDGPDNSQAVGDGLGQKARWLSAILASAPLAHWTETWGLRPDQIIDITMRNEEWRKAIMLGWREAARRQKNAAWQEAMLTFFVHNFSRMQDVPEMAHSDFSAIPYARAEQIWMPILSKSPANPTAPFPMACLLLTTFAVGHRKWKDELAMQIIRVAVADMRRTAAAGRLDHYEVGLLECASSSASPILGELLSSLWQDSKTLLHPASLAVVNRFLDTMHFRLTLHRAFEEEVS